MFPDRLNGCPPLTPPLQVGPITSNFIGLMNENGVSGQSVNLTFLVYGPTGKTASASVISFQSDSFNKMAITVRETGLDVISHTL